MAAKLVTLPYFAWLVLTCLLVVSVSAIPSKKIISLKLIKQVNSKGPYVGLLTVFPPEERAFLGTGDFKPNPEHPFVDLSGRRYRVGTIYGKKVIYVRCGIGMVNAAAVTQQMLDLFDVAGIVHFGISGNINNSMSIGDVSIPKQFANTGLWNWLNPKGAVDPDDVAQLEVGKYNVPKGDGVNLLGKLSYSPEQLFSVSREPNDATTLFWAGVSQHWLKLASSLEGMELEKCVNSSLCLPQKPKLVVGLKGSTADIFVDNAAYRDFLYKAFGVSSADMESSATCLSNGIPVIAIRGMSDLAGGQSGENAMDTYGSLAALNTAKAVLKFISKLPGYNSR
ncbi:bark storage protein A [Populus alba x Populus x berolinensis]|uniref:Bark storage protein A n=1 Tax=Populus alba x Populus x berolinensis TaxID=444605 RepID=A0AAD6QBY9_9ROSI|nr:bark storage protein A [Populus alba x Populus x berolinensis]